RCHASSKPNRPAASSAAAHPRPRQATPAARTGGYRRANTAATPSTKYGATTGSAYHQDGNPNTGRSRSRPTSTPLPRRPRPKSQAAATALGACRSGSGAGTGFPLPAEVSIRQTIRAELPPRQDAHLAAGDLHRSVRVIGDGPAPDVPTLPVQVDEALAAQADHPAVAGRRERHLAAQVRTHPERAAVGPDRDQVARAGEEDDRPVVRQHGPRPGADRGGEPPPRLDALRVDGLQRAVGRYVQRAAFGRRHAAQGLSGRLDLPPERTAGRDRPDPAG